MLLCEVKGSRGWFAELGELQVIAVTLSKHFLNEESEGAWGKTQIGPRSRKEKVSISHENFEVLVAKLLLRGSFRAEHVSVDGGS